MSSSHRLARAWPVAILALVLLAACETPENASARCTKDSDCGTGGQCDTATGKCNVQGDFPCDDVAKCQKALENKLWNPAEKGLPCFEAQCVKQLCDMVPKQAGTACEGGDGFDCTKAQCDAQGKCAGGEEPETGWCIVDKCYAAGAEGPDCKTCDPTANAKGWTLDKDKCLIDGKCVDRGSAKDDKSPCLICRPEVQKDAYSLADDGTPCTDGEALDCTTDTCGQGACKHTPKSGFCVMDGKCAGAGELDPANSCLACDPTVSQTQYSPRAEKSACGLKDAPCLVGECDAKQVCVNQGPKDGSCYIDGKCFDGGAKDEGGCNVCDPKANKQWTALPAGTTCVDDSQPCTVDACDATGTCDHVPNDAACKGDACSVGVCDKATGCGTAFKDAGVVCESDGVACTKEACDGKGVCPTSSAQPNDALCSDGVDCTIDKCDLKVDCVHTPEAKPTCEDGNACTADSCDPKAGCKHQDLTGDACTSDGLPCTDEKCLQGTCQKTVNAGECAIGGACQKAGDKTDGGCKTCDPSKSATTWQIAAAGTACASDDVACTDDACDASGTCQHAPVVAKCDDALPCTADSCDVKAGCVNTDSCAWGHACSATAKACLTSQPVVLAEQGVDGLVAPTNPAIVQHVLDEKAGTTRTWVVFQSDTAAAVKDGAWQIAGKSVMHAMILDPQVAAPDKKVKPKLLTLPPATSLAAKNAPIVQAFPVVTPDPQAPGVAWLAWLEAAPTLTDGCLGNAGQGGVLRLARLDGSAVPGDGKWALVAGETCSKGAITGPLFLTSGFALLDQANGSTAAASERTVLTLRPIGGDLANWTTALGLQSGPADKLSTVSSLIGTFAKVHPVLADLGTGDPKQRYLAIAATEDAGEWGLWAAPITSAGVKGTPVDWTAKTPVSDVLTGATAVCAIDAAVQGNKLGIAVLIRKAGNDEVHLIERSGDGKVTAVLAGSKKSKGDCRFGLAANRVQPFQGKWLVSLYEATFAGAPELGAASYVLVGTTAGGLTPLDVTLTASDTSKATDLTQALAWRGLGGMVVRADGTVTWALEAQNLSSKRQVVLHTAKP